MFMSNVGLQVKFPNKTVGVATDDIPPDSPPPKKRARLVCPESADYTDTTSYSPNDTDVTYSPSVSSLCDSPITM